MDEETKKYFNGLKGDIDKIYEIATTARSLGFDPSSEVEAMPTGDLATRVEGLVGPVGIAAKIKEYGRSDTAIAKIINNIVDKNPNLPKRNKELQIEQALRTSLAIVTEGVVAAPIEGISGVKIRENPDGSEYLSVYFSGPIRSAGGTAQGFAVLIADYIRKLFGLREYRPTNDEVERYVEEIKLYNERVDRLQYLPSDDDIRTIIKNVAVCVDGDPTEDVEVSIHRDLSRVETNRVRSGMCLVIAEGIAQKSRKIAKHATNLGLDWVFLSIIEKGIKKAEEKQTTEIKPLHKFMDEIIGGRPVFGAPSAKGTFRLRYGRSRASGIAGKSIHPATMILLDNFIATGTQIKVERPGKGCVITACDSIEGPIVRLRDNSVIRVDDVNLAKEINSQVEEILFLGDILVSYGDFLQTNSLLLPAGYCEEWWFQEAERAGLKIENIPSPEEAIRISEQYKIPLHPRYTYNWEDLTVKDIRALVDWTCTGTVDNKFIIENNNPEAKRILELLGVPHKIENNFVIIKEYLPLLYPLGVLKENKCDKERFNFLSTNLDPELNAFELIKILSPIEIRRKVGAYIGCRMGRPEKAKERKMQPAVHGLFPIGDAGGKERIVNTAAENEYIKVEVARYYCQDCDIASISAKCPNCNKSLTLKKFCRSCSWSGNLETCPRCKIPTQFYKISEVPIKRLWKNAIEKVGHVDGVKGVIGMISEYKIPEPLEKGTLRAKNNVFVFKDGTTRFDATDAPLTHFKPKEIHVTVDRLKELGYTKDYLGNDLTDDDQIIEIKVQDVVIPMKGAEYLLRISHFIDDLLVKFYKLEPFYNSKSIEDLLGHLIIGLAPHTSAGITGRIIGFTDAHVCYAHPYWHAAKRRNADGDEDAFMLLLDVLLNFSRFYLPAQRGGKMDAPLIITTLLNPKEVDDEVHKMEIGTGYPIEFYEKTQTYASPSDVKEYVKTVGDILDTNPYSGIKFTHDTTDINGPVTESRYVSLKTMEEKVDAQLAIAKKIRAVDENEVAELVINSHFLRDTYGNLRAFSRQRFRCVKCNANYRRVPLIGKCTKCGGKLLLTVSEGNIRKYLETSIKLADKYGLPDYLKQRLSLLGREINSLFTNELSKQVSLSDFM